MKSIAADVHLDHPMALTEIVIGVSDGSRANLRAVIRSFVREDRPPEELLGHKCLVTANRFG
jgi:hypothetical protein